MNSPEKLQHLASSDNNRLEGSRSEKTACAAWSPQTASLLFISDVGEAVSIEDMEADYLTVQILISLKNAMLHSP